MSVPPPTYDKAQEASGAGGFQSPPPGNQGFNPGTNVIHTQRPPVLFGQDPVTTTCQNCQSNITTSVDVETGGIAWITAGVLCFLGCCCCAPIPLCMDSMKDATHKCPNCNAVVGRYKAKF